MDTPDEQADQLAALAEAALPDPELTGPELPPGAGFIVTKEHRRFAEFAAAVRRDRYIGLCYGPPGVGKTASARRYACWHELEPLLRAPGRHFTEGRDRADWHTLLYTPTVSATPRMIDKELTQLGWDLTTIRTPDPFDRRTYASTHALPSFVELLIIDEADRLKTTALEQLRDHYDRSRLGMILIGMPGIEKRLARYPQLYSRIGSSTNTGRCPPPNCSSSCSTTGPSWASRCPPMTSPTPKPSRPSPASPAATSASFSACSLRSSASWRSTT